MDIWGHQLVATRPFFSDDTMIIRAGFIINNLEVNPVAEFLEGGHNIVIGGDTIRLEGFDINGVTVSVIGKYDVLIPTARAV